MAPHNQPAARSLDDSTVIDQIEAYRRARALGHPVHREQLLQKFPEIAAQLNACLDALDAVNQLASEVRQMDTPPGTFGGRKLDEPHVLGDFRLLREIGHGGMGVVYEAEQISLGRRVAVKILPYASLWSETALHRFEQEVRLAAMLEHPHIVPIYTVGCECDIHFYAMKLIDGCSLSDVIVSFNPQPQARTGSVETRNPRSSAASDDSHRPEIDSTRPRLRLRVKQDADTVVAEVSTTVVGDETRYRAAARLAKQAASALAFAHQQGVIHRDIKPSNLLLDRQGRLYIADFGLARSGSDPNLTRTGDLLGTPRYMSPEQASGSAKTMDERTDIYSLGATLYELLTLHPVIQTPGRAAAIRELRDLQVIAPRTIDPTIPQPLEQIVLKCLQADPVDRYKSTAELVEDLDRYLAGQPVQARYPGIVRRTSRWLQLHPQMTLAAMVALIAISLISTFSFWVSQHGWLGSTGQRGPPPSELADLKSSSPTIPPNFSSPQESPDMLRPNETKRNSARTAMRRQHHRQLVVEKLEDRSLMAVDISISDGWAIEDSIATRYIDEFVTTGSGGLSGARNMVFRNGDLYVVSAESDSILLYDAETGAFKSEFVTSGSGGLDYPQDIAFDSQGNMYVASQYTNEILRYNSNGTPDASPFVGAGEGLNSPSGIAFGPDGLLYVGSVLNKVLRYQGPSGINPGEFIDVFADDYGGGRIEFGPDGKLYVHGGDSFGRDAILRATGVSGAPMEIFVPFGSAGFTEGRDFRFDGDGNLIVVNQVNNEVLRFQGPYGTNPGAFVDKLVPSGLGGLVRPIGIGLGSDGYIYISSYTNNEVLRYGKSYLAAFSVSLNSASSATVTVEYSTTVGTADGSDFIEVSASAPGMLTFAPGQVTQTIIVPTRQDSTSEQSEMFTVSLSDSIGATIIDGTGSGTILDNDPFTKFYVVNDGTSVATDQTFRYQADGQSAGSATGLGSGNTLPRGVASNAAGDRVWVVDDNGASKKVYVYDTNGVLLGNWTAGSLSSTAQVEGITTNGADVWIVDNKADRVYRYANAAGILSGTLTAADSFPLNNNNKNPKDIVTDGTSLWVVNDAGTDKVFKYMLGGFLLGSWTLTAGGGSPTGITLDSSGGQQHLWVVDNTTDRVYQYDNARSRTSGSQTSSTTFALAAGNTNPQGIADPPVPSDGEESISSGNLASAAELLNLAWVPPLPTSTSIRDTFFGQVASTRDEPDDFAWFDDLVANMQVDQKHAASMPQRTTADWSTGEASVFDREPSADNDMAILSLEELSSPDLEP